MALSPGTRIGPYEVGSLLGIGGMGEVYRARDTRLDRDVAIKVLPPALGHDRERLARFEREAKSLGALSHPHIATIYGLEDAGPSERAIVMELVEGATLADRLARGPLPLTDALRIARDIADALEAAHERGIVHRDLKPANVKAPVDGATKVLDFGLATAAQPDVDPGANPDESPTQALTIGATEAGVILGTAAYMSPEQASARRVDKRSDIWSFGVVLWEMLAGARLFKGETVSHTLADVLRAEIDFTRVPAGPVRDLVRRCLERDVRKRLRDVGEARIAIEGWLADPERLTAAPAVGARTATRAPVAWRVAAVVAALLLVALGSATWRHLTEVAAPPAVLSLLPPVGASFGIEGGGGPGLAVSPDGRRVVFRDWVDGESTLWLRELDSPEARVLPGTEGAGIPFWAPDGRRIAFVAGGKLKKLDVAGGPPVTLTDARSSGGSWSQDDVILFIPPGPSGVSRIPAAGGTPVAVLQVDQSTSEVGHAFPSFLPDGRHFLFSSQFRDPARDGVYIGDLESTDRQRLLEARITPAQYVAPGHLLYARDGTLFAQPFDAASRVLSGEPVPLAEEVGVGPVYSSRGNVLAYLRTAGRRDQLAWFDRTGRQLGVEGAPGDLEWFSLSPDGTRVVFARRDERSRLFDLWLRDLKRGTESRLTFAGNNNFPVWSPDDAQIYFTKMIEGKIVRISADGSGEEALVLDGVGARVVHPSPDGRYLLSSTGNSTPNTGSDVWAQPLGSNAKAFPVLQTRFSENAGGLSPDGRWLAYWSNETGRSEVYVRGFPDPVGKWQVSVRGGILPVWSADGRELFYYNDSKMMSVDVQSGRAFTPGQPRELFEFRLAGGNTSFAVARDGRFLLPVSVEENAVRAMTVVLNWQQLLAR